MAYWTITIFGGAFQLLLLDSQITLFKILVDLAANREIYIAVELSIGVLYCHNPFYIFVYPLIHTTLSLRVSFVGQVRLL